MQKIKEESIRIHLLNSNTLTRTGLRYIVETQADMRVVAQTGINGAQL